jgi:hypothetical protein
LFENVNEAINYFNQNTEMGTRAYMEKIGGVMENIHSQMDGCANLVA